MMTQVEPLNTEAENHLRFCFIRLFKIIYLPFISTKRYKLDKRHFRNGTALAHDTPKQMSVFAKIGKTAVNSRSDSLLIIRFYPCQ